MSARCAARSARSWVSPRRRWWCSRLPRPPRCQRHCR
jgi:hypothetical protein